MNEILQRIRTEFTGSSAGLRKEIDSIKTASAAAKAEMSALHKESEQTLKEIDDIIKSPTSIQKGFTNTAGKNKFFDEFSAVEKDLNDLLYGDNERMADPWMLTELERMRTAAAAATPAVAGLGVAGTKAKTGFAGLKDQVGGTLGPLKFLKENLAFVGLGVFGVVEAVEALAESLDHGKQIAKEFKEMLAQIPQQFAELQAARDRFEGKPTDKNEGRLIDIAGSKDVSGFGDKGGAWQMWSENAAKAQDQIDILRDRAEFLGLELDENWRIIKETNAASFVGAKAMAQQNELSDQLSQALDVAAFIEKQLVLTGAEHAKVLADQVSQAEILKSVMAEVAAIASNTEIMDFVGIAAKNMGETLAASMPDALDVGAAASALKPLTSFAEDVWEGFSGQKKRGFEAWLTKGLEDLGLTKDKPRGGRANIDARGAKITVNTRLETDDPGRFADVAIKSAFLATVARPQSATWGLGSPPVGGSR